MITDMEKAIQIKLEYYKRQKHILEAHHTKAASIRLRNHMLERQKIKNYSNEAERIKSEVSKTTLNSQTIHFLKQRADNLIKLGAQIY